MRLGEVVAVYNVEGSDKLYKLKVDFGEIEDIEEDSAGVIVIRKAPKYRNVFSGIKKYVKEEYLLGKQFVFVTNLEPRKIMNEYSEAMILAASDEEGNFTLFPSQSKLPNGTRLK